MVQMANDVLLYNMKHYGWTVSTYKRAALAFNDHVDGYLFYPQLASKVGESLDVRRGRNPF